MSNDDEGNKTDPELLRKAKLQALEKISGEATRNLFKSMQTLQDQQKNITEMYRFPKILEALRKNDLGKKLGAEAVQTLAPKPESMSPHSAKAVAEMAEVFRHQAKQEAEDRRLTREAQKAMVEQPAYLEQIIEQNINLTNAIAELTRSTVEFEQAKAMNADLQGKMAKRTEAAAWISAGLAAAAIIVSLFQKPPIVTVESPKAPIVNVKPPVVNIPATDFGPLIKEIRKLRPQQKQQETMK